jgi:hypothetical protein
MDHLRRYKMYFYNDKYVYKSCGNYIVVLEKLHDTITNEYRYNIIDHEFAKYRANKLKVLLIIHKFDPTIVLREIQNSFYRKKITYIVNEILNVIDYDMNSERVCSTGIHYFKTIEQSFFWELLEHNPTYTGKFIQWHENGSKYYEGEYKEGKQEGKWIKWDQNGKIGWFEWHANGIQIN